jgi:hypothetical protein
MNTNNDYDYKEERNSFEEDDNNDDDNDDAPVVVSHTQTSKGSTSHCMIECEDEEVGYEYHDKISKKLSHSFSGSGCSSTPKPSPQKKSQISLHEPEDRQ